MGANPSHDMAAPVIVASQAKHTASLIFLHGLGDTGHGWASMFRDFGLKNVRCVCPTAPIQPVSLNGRMKMPSWFDITGLSADSPEDEEGILSASESLKKLIEEEEKLGIPSSRIMIGGFSQGGSVALYTAFTMKKPLAGILALSTWMPLNKKFPAVVQGNTDIPVLQCHGTDDPLVSIRWGQLTGTLISTFNKHHQLKIYSGMVHSSCDQELKDVKVFLEANLKD